MVRGKGYDNGLGLWLDVRAVDRVMVRGKGHD